MPMKKLFFPFFIALFSCCCFAQNQNQLPKNVTLPNGWSLSPAGRSFPLGDLPLNIAVSPSQKFLAVTNNGQSTQSIQLIDARTEKILDNIIVAKSWLGLKFSADEKYLYASGGNDNWVLKYAIKNNKLILKDSLILGAKWPNKISPAGIEIDDAKHVLYVVTKDNNSLYICNLITKKVEHDPIALGAEAYTCLLSPDKKELYISVWGGDKIKIFNTQQNEITDSIDVGDNPNDMSLTKNVK
jgi:DNA-binding beta-propeller fold protein YncE